MKIVLAGPQGAGKSAVGRALADRLGVPFFETDEAVEALAARESGAGAEGAEGAPKRCRELYRALGAEAFRALERRAVAELAPRSWCVVSTGGSTLLDPENRAALRTDAVLVVVHAPAATLWERVSAKGVPAYLTEADPRRQFEALAAHKLEVLRPYADILFDTEGHSVEAIAEALEAEIGAEVARRAGSFSSAGTVLHVQTFGESHGKAIGAILDGVPPGLPLEEADIQKELDRRRPGQSAVSTARKEADQVQILSGVFEGKTTGASIGLVIFNKDQRPGHYDSFKHLFRPGHADFTFWAKYGHRDHRGGGRSSGRETAARTACGAVARKLLAERGVTITAHAIEIAGIEATARDLSGIESNPVRCADPEAAARMSAAIVAAKEAGDSVGGVVQIEIEGVPAGLGDPVFGKADARLAGMLFSLGAVKGVEIGAGFAVARRKGSENNDPMENGAFRSNHAGGILGGITTGAPITLRIAVKPTASIALAQSTTSTTGGAETFQIEGRHDPCIVPRIVPVAESVTALVLLDLLLIQEGLRPDRDPFAPPLPQG